MDVNQRMNLKRATGDTFEFSRTWTTERRRRLAAVMQRTRLTAFLQWRTVARHVQVNYEVNDRSVTAAEPQDDLRPSVKPRLP